MAYHSSVLSLARPEFIERVEVSLFTAFFPIEKHQF
jgi:hypothetical protein